MYNLVSALLWSVLFVRTVAIFPVHGNAIVWDKLHTFARWVQTLAVIDICNAALGIVHASPLTTALQVGGRNCILWIMRSYPEVAAGQWAYSAMLMTWGVAEVVRYGYFALERATGTAPRWLVWTRYNMFVVLYPIGIPCEAWLVYKVVEPSRESSSAYPYLLWLGLSAYVPGRCSDGRRSTPQGLLTLCTDDIRSNLRALQAHVCPEAEGGAEDGLSWGGISCFFDCTSTSTRWGAPSFGGT
jgi:very-long-chain (3R)-3-hydroxyacyl-CoA dehydratase